MAEQAQNGPQDNPAPQQPPAEAAPPSAAEDALLHPGPPTDDQPTIISRKKPAPVTSEDALASVLRGKRLAHYELLAPIGVGGMAAVIRARDTQLDRTVALKILPPDMAVDSENVQRFHQEARAAAKLDHENIARAFFCGEDQGLHFIAFEYVEGENLRQLLERRGRLPVSEALHYLLQIATGLAHAAARGVVHRDIKPSNIIISPNGRAKLVDMGLARSLHHDNGLTQSGVTLGTFDYISPEQAMEPRDADCRSDIYSLGCTAYHMLTGQPPVPEGTAAKKLHHHQHIDPLDPRTLNPQVPDEVAALLSRMMAKDPKQRYQRPEDLVQHLLYLAQKYGAATQRSDGVLFVEAPLLAPARTRPMLLTAIAVAALLLLIAVLGQTSPWPAERRARDTDRASTDDRTGKTENTGAKTEDRDGKAEPRELVSPPPMEPRNDPRTVPPTVLTARTVRELADILEKQPHAVVQIGEDFNLRSLDEALTITGGDVTLQAEAGKRPTIRLTYDGSAGGDLWAALTIKAGRVKLVGLRFEVDATEAPELVMTAIALQGGHLTVEKCEFDQSHPPPDPRQGSLSSVSILPLPRGEARLDERGARMSKGRVGGPLQPAEGDKAPLSLRECVFVGGQRALTSTVPVTVNLTNCAIGPHSAAVFHLQGASPVDVRLFYCAVLVGDAPVFRMQDGAAGVLNVNESIFAGVKGQGTGMREDMESGTSQSVLIHQSGTPTGLVRYVGQANAYFNLKAYWQLPQGTDVAKYADFRQRFAQDERSHELSTSPWQDADPVALLRRNEPRLAFQISANLRELRTGPDGTRAIGVQRGPWGGYDPLPRLEEPKPVEAVVRPEKIVDPTGMEPGAYRTLNGAIGEAKPGDVILIKHNGRLRVDAARLEKASLDLTIRPHPDFRPVLTLGEATDSDAALFRLHDGKLRLENLQFALPPPRAEFRTQTVVAMLGDGQCLFKDCVATLEETPAVQMSLITLVDPSSVMRMGPSSRPQGPSLRLEGCFIRGSGDLMAVRPSRPFELQVEDSLVSLEGSLLVVEGAAREPPQASVSQIQLKKVTAYLTDHLVWLKAAREEGRMGRGLVPTQVSLQNNLLSAASGKSLIHLEGVDTDEQMKRLFVWNGGQHNAYSNFTQMLDQQPREQEQMAPPPYDKARWERFTTETDAHFERVKFASPPAESQHARATPGDFKVKAEAGLQGCGADLDHLPQPLDDVASEE